MALAVAPEGAGTMIKEVFRVIIRYIAD